MGDNPLYRSNYLNVDPWPFESGEVAAGQNQLQGLAERARAWFAPGEAARAGIPGKVLGVLGLDDSGARAATSWGDAAKHSVLSMVGHGFVEGITGQGQRLMDGSRYATMGGVSRGEDDGMGPAGLMTAAALPMGSAIASRVAPGVAREAAPRVNSNPSEASPLAGLLSGAGEKPGTSSNAGRPLGSHEPNLPPSAPMAVDPQGRIPSSGRLGPDSRSSMPHDPSLDAWIDNLGLVRGRKLTNDIARAARDQSEYAPGAFENYGIRLTDKPLQVGTEAPGSHHFYQDFVSENHPTFGRDAYPDHMEPLGGTSTVGLDLTPEGIADARKRIPAYYHDNASLLGGDRAWHGADPGELVIKSPQVLASVPHIPGRKGEPLFSNPDSASPLALLQAGRENKGITAYHGSPHDFDRFSMDKIGTGEGAQAYGHGLYFAEKEGVAKQYRDALAPLPKRMIDDTGNPTLNNVLGLTGGDVARARQTLANDVADGQKRGRPAVVSRAQSALDRLEELDRSGKFPSPEKSPGHMYEVRINADPEHFLDWDKPLSQQSEKVRQALPSDLHSLPGQEAYRKLAERQREGKRTGDPLDDVLFDMPITDHQRASNAIRDAGIPGIRYLDQGSRTAGEGSRNYVVFNDKIIDIVKKYGIAAAASMYGFSRVNEAMAGGQDAAPQNALAPYSIP